MSWNMWKVWEMREMVIESSQHFSIIFYSRTAQCVVASMIVLIILMKCGKVGWPFLLSGRVGAWSDENRIQLLLLSFDLFYRYLPVPMFTFMIIIVKHLLKLHFWNKLLAWLSICNSSTCRTCVFLSFVILILST